MKYMITKTLILTSILGCFAIANADTINETYPEISFTMKDKSLIQTNTALVYVTVNTTIFKSDEKHTKIEALSTLQKSLPSVKWKVSSYDQQEAASGAMNTKTIIQGRLTQNEIDDLRKAIKLNSYNQKITINVSEFTPTDGNVQKLQQELMINMYNNIKHYVSELNNKTDSKYTIQEVRYNAQPVSYNNSRQSQVLMYAKNNNANVEVTNEVNLTAFIKLADKSKS